MEGFIMGGVEIGIDQYPWLALIAMDNDVHCGGVIVSSRVVMTAGHCIVDEENNLLDAQKFIVYLGSTRALQGRKYYPCKLYPHPKFNITSVLFYFYDIGLMLLSSNIKFDNNVRKSHILSERRTFRDENFKMVVAGWGRTHTYGATSEKLKMTRMWYVSNKRCNNSQTGDGLPMPVPNHMFCMIADRATSDCFGDSGSGVMLGIDLVGIVSTGRDTACGSEIMPTMYTDVTYFRKWIENIVGALESKQFKECLNSNNNLEILVNETNRQVFLHNTANDINYYGWVGLALLPRNGRMYKITKQNKGPQRKTLIY